MRRNFPRMSKSGAASGPLMTNHLELQDLDLELELLKRKREMIEQQQHQLANDRQFNSRQRQYGYNEPPQMFQGQQQNFSNNFGQSSAAPLIGNHFSGSILGKRSSESKWNSNSAPKRFSGPQGGSKKKFGAPPPRRSDPNDRPAPFAKQGPNRNQNSQPKPPSQPHQPWNQLPFYMGNSSVLPSQRFNSSKSKPVKRDFKPSKVTKPKTTSSNFANKLVSYPLPKQKVLPKDAPKLVNQVEETLDSFILHADKVPNQQVAGRLELALGSISKDIKTAFADDSRYKESFLSHIFLREVKQAIRERLRTVMLGKHVGKVANVVAQYRKVFPNESDLEIVTVALEALKAANNKKISIKLEDSDSPETYFKMNMDELICKSLDDIFEKLYETYSGEHSEELKQVTREILKETPEDFSKDVDINDLQQKKDDDNVSLKKDDTKVTLKKDDDNVTLKKDDENDTLKKDDENDTLKKDDDNVTIKKDEQTENNGDTVKEEEDKKEKEKEVDASNEESMKDDTKMESESKANIDTSNTSHCLDAGPKDFQIKQRIKKMEYFIGLILKRRLGVILPKYKKTLCRILNTDEDYLEVKEMIVAKLQDKLSIETRMIAAKQRNASAGKDTSTVSEATAPTASTPTAVTQVLPYYVKILGRPTLPKRKQMQTFLQQYNPKSIKKHRSMHLLFVGFDSKDDFDKMLAIKETIIGNSKIFIKVSERSVNEKQNVSNISAISKDDDAHLIKNNSGTSGDLLGSDLDDQINNLLTSIRQEEERSMDEAIGGDVDVKAIKNTEAEKEKSGDSAFVDKEKSGDGASLDKEKTDDMATEAIENGQSGAEVTPSDNTANLPAADEKGEVVADEDVAVEESTEKTENEGDDKLTALKNEKESGRATPTRASARAANVTPSTIRTRRASRLAQN